MLGSYNSKPPSYGLRAIKGAMRFCVGTLNKKLCAQDGHRGKVDIGVYSDADLAGLHGVSGETRSRGGKLVAVNGMPVSWGSNWVGTVLSSAESEAIAASETIKIALMIRNIAEELNVPVPERLRVNVDASAAIAFAGKAKGNGRMKHIDLRTAWVRILRDTQEIEIVKISGESNPADYLTKLLGAQATIDWVNQWKVSVRCEEVPPGLRGHGESLEGHSRSTIP